MGLLLILIVGLLIRGLDLCAALNDEGISLLRFRDRVEIDPYGALADWDEGAGGDSPCSWFGVGCSGGRVVDLNLSNLLLKGILVPQLGSLVQLKSLILHNNCFYGAIPAEIAKLQKLRVLDLEYNNFSGPIPPDLTKMISLEILILPSNRFSSSMSTELHQLNVVSELGVDDHRLSSNAGSIRRNIGNASIRRLMQVDNKDEGKHQENGHHNGKYLIKISASPSQIPVHVNEQLAASGLPFLSPFLQSHGSPLPTVPATSPSASFPASPGINMPAPVRAPSPSNKPAAQLLHKPPPFNAKSPSALRDLPTKNHSPFVLNHLPSVPAVTESRHITSWVLYMPVAAGASILVALSAIVFLCYRANRVVTVKPWSTGLSGQLQKALLADGVPALKRSELETACEDFSNVIGSLPDCILYKGTLSSGIEIAVASSLISSANDWSKDYESRFRDKISRLSRVNHKNFMNLLGYCVVEKPFTRMMVFEYAPNGSLFEHLHFKEAEHLNWAARLRIAMGIAYCLEHMQQLEPPVFVRNLNSSSIYLTEDYAAKISDLEFRCHPKEANQATESSRPSRRFPSDPKVVVYKFGIILLEILSGRRPFSEDDGLLVCWASSYFDGRRPLNGMIDTTLQSFREKDLGALSEVVHSCIDPDPRKRPAMSEVTKDLRQITSISPDAASPRLSPLWWAELEILSIEGN